MWPTYSDRESPYFGDGERYGTELGRISPEGNVYGTIRFVREFLHQVWWTGAAWTDVEVAGKVDYANQLPSGRPFGEIWQAANEKGKIVEYFKDISAWKQLDWKADIEGFDNLPRPGNFVGEAHTVKELNVPLVWVGYAWERLKHESLDEDQQNRHLPPGFLQFLAPDARVVFVSPSEVNLQAVKGGSGKVWVNGEYVAASLSSSVYNHLASLEWDSQRDFLIPATLIPSTDYWIYLANTKDPAFNLTDWDYRGKLFLSRSPDVNGYLSSTGAGKNARLVGQVRTDGSEMPLFIPEIDISLISRTTNFPETFREYSDYQVVFVDQDNLELALIDGDYGQIYCAGELIYLGQNFLIPRNSARVRWNPSDDEKLSLDSSQISNDVQYYMYLASSVDAFNFNSINEDTNRPWQGSDAGYEQNYDETLDLRQRPFLSTKAPEQGRMSVQWPGYYTRLLGQVKTDANGLFTNARDLSAIRQPTLNPSYFDGLAECQLEKISDTELRLVKKLATSGVINVAGEAVQTYERLELEDVHRIFSSDTIYSYTEANIASPLTANGTVGERTNDTVYLYVANSRDHWGELAGKTFFTACAPVRGYLSRNWPGNTARWIATLKMSDSGTFGQNSFVDSITPAVAVIDDNSNSQYTTLSSAYILSALSDIKLMIGQQAIQSILYNQQQMGCGLLLQRYDSTHIVIKPTGSSPATVITADEASIQVPMDGLYASTSGMSPGSIYYVYLNQSGLVISSSAPTNSLGLMEWLPDYSLLVGWVTCDASGALPGVWNVVSYWNDPDIELTFSVLPEVEYDWKIPWNGGRVGYGEYNYTSSVPMVGAINDDTKARWTIGRSGQDTIIQAISIGGWAGFLPISTPKDAFGETTGTYSTYGGLWGVNSSYTLDSDGAIFNTINLRRQMWEQPPSDQQPVEERYDTVSGSLIVTRKRMIAQ